jgi:hypothetical protein
MQRSSSPELRRAAAAPPVILDVTEPAQIPAAVERKAEGV